MEQSKANGIVYDLAIIGGGIIGAATMYKIQQKYPDLRILLLEKEDELAAHQTGYNSGVIHSGIYYKPGSMKAENCVNGRRQLVAFARTHDIPHEVCGKVIVATAEKELPVLRKIFANGEKNGIEGMEWVGPDAIREREPHCSNAIQGIHVPCTGIIDYRATTEKMVELATAIQPESKVMLGEEVKAHEHEKGKVTIHCTKKTYSASNIIFCGGLHADRLARQENFDLKEKVVGFRGDFYELTEAGKQKVNHLIYPVPDPNFPFLGVHFTRMVNGDVECGPNAVFTFKREGYKRTSFDLKDTLEALSYPGTWKLFRKHWRFGLDEYRRAFSKQRFLKRLQRLIPELGSADIERGRSGVRALLLDRNGEMVDDFRIEYRGNAIHVLNAPSPAATAALSIGDYIRDMSERYHDLGQLVKK